MSGGVLVLSHLFPSSARPGVGPFVADEVAALAKTTRLLVVAPVRWLPPAPVDSWRRERRVPRSSTAGGVEVYRPRVLALPLGGIALEATLWPQQLRMLVRAVRGHLPVSGLHAHFGLPDGWAAMRLAREIAVPFVVTLHGSDVFAFPRKASARALLRQTLRGASHVIAASDDIAERAAALGADETRVSVVPCGVPQSVVHRASHVQARAALALAEDEEWVFWAGALIPRKQPLHMLEAFTRLAARRPHLRLALAGDGPLRAAVDDYVVRNAISARVVVTGFLPREEIAMWHHAADLFCNTSTFEGTPVSVMEALACGTPVAAYPVGGIPAIVSGTVGSLTTTSTPVALAAMIDAELAAPRDRSAIAAVGARFGIEASSARVRAVYEKAFGV